MPESGHNTVTQPISSQIPVPSFVYNGSFHSARESLTSASLLDDRVRLGAVGIPNLSLKYCHLERSSFGSRAMF